MTSEYSGLDGVDTGPLSNRGLSIDRRCSEYRADEFRRKKFLRDNRLMKLSVVVPVRDEAPVIPDLIPRLTSALGALDEWEVVFVDDGSVDSTWELLRAAAE